MLIDYHIHTSWSDGNYTIEEAVERAKEIGLSAIAITDHARKDSQWVPNYLKHLSNIKNKERELKIIKGIEVKIIDTSGEIDLNRNWLQNLDVVLVGVHKIPGVNDKNDLVRIKERIPHIYAELILAAIKKVQLPKPTIIAHPGKYLRENHLNYIPREYWEEIADEAKKNNKIIEYNTSSPLPKDFLQLLISKNIKISIGSDAHKLEEIGKGVKEAIKIIGNKLIHL